MKEPLKKKSVKVLCVDDNEMVGESVQAMLEEEGGFEWCGQLYDANDLVETAEREQPDIILLDIDMPGKDAFEALDELSIVCPESRVLMLSVHTNSDYVNRAFEVGAWGYLSKSGGARAIVDGVRQVMRGEVVRGPDVEWLY